MISNQTIKRLPNTYIWGKSYIEVPNQYMVSINCPTQLVLSIRCNKDQCKWSRYALSASQNWFTVFTMYRRVQWIQQMQKVFYLHLFCIIYFILAALFLFIIPFLLKLTVTSGTINGITLYINIILIFSPDFNLSLQKFLHSYIEIINIGPPSELCLYHGMNQYAKVWIQLTYPIYLILIAVLFIIGSCYSTKLYRLTHNRALPALATLFMLTYNNILQAIASAPLYTTIITIPSHNSKSLWILDPTIPLFGWKFSLLISVCLLLFLLLLMFNAILLFTKPLMRFRIIHRFKPVIDAFQGPFISTNINTGLVYIYW